MSNSKSFCRFIIESTLVYFTFGVGLGALERPDEQRTLARENKRLLTPADYGAKCNGSADDTLELNLLFVAASATSTQVVIPHGEQCNARQLTISSHTTIAIEGTLFQIAGSNTDFLTMASGTVDVSIIGTGTINGNRANQAPESSLYPGACINAFGVTGLFVGPITITQCPKYPINVWSNGGSTVSPSNATLRDTVMSYSGNSPEFVRCTNCWAYDVHSQHIDDYAFSFYQGTFHSGAIGGTFDYSGGGISVLTDAPDGLMSDDVKIEATSASYNDGPAYLTWNNGGPGGQQHTNIHFASVRGDHNHLDAGNSGSQNFGGVWMQACAGCSATDYLFHHDGAQKNEVSPGVFLANLVTRPTITGGRIYDEGQGGTGIGISVNPDTVQPLITGNTIWDDQPTKTIAFGLNGTCSTGNFCQVYGNNLMGTYLGAADNITYGTDGLHYGNRPASGMRGLNSEQAYNGNTPSVTSSAPGSSISLTSYTSDQAGDVSVTATAASTVTIKFGAPFRRAPDCTVTPYGNIRSQIYIAGIEATQLLVNLAGGSGGFFSYRCRAR